jgi:glycosyltransferase involved in cell wall biosynthesis
MKELRKSISSLLLYFPVLLYNAIRLKQIIRAHKIDVITVNDFYNLLPAVYRFLGGKIPYICYVRFLPSKFPAALVRFWCAWHNRYAHQTVVVSNAVKKELPYQQNVVVIGNELPPEPAAFTSTHYCNTILYPANYIQGKGQEFALESFSHICRNHPRWKLRFVGGDMGLAKNKAFKRELMALANRLWLQNNVEWHTFSDRLSEEYLTSGIVLNFSESESFSLTCLEGMYYGRPVIATRSGGPSEIIDQNDTGILVDIGDINAMANAMDYLMSNVDKRETMAHRAYEKIREKFSYANTIQKLREVYEGAIKVVKR